jgi:tRNA(fMet)-specific endonuclease VapC
MDAVVIDTSVIIDHSRAGIGQFKELLELKMNDDVQLYMPTIVVSELWAGSESKTKTGLSKLNKILQPFELVELSIPIAKIVGELIRDKQVFGFDAIIAASALYLKARVATGNRKHFTKVSGLKLFN